MKRLLPILIAIFCLFPNILRAAPAVQYQGEVTSPRPNAVLRGQVVIEGTAYHPELWKYEVWFTPGLNPNVPDNQWIRILVKEEQAIQNGQLAVWNTSAIADGVYTLRLRVVRRDGNWQDVNIFPLNVANSTPPTPTLAPATPTLPILPTVPPTPTVPPLPTAPPSPTPLPALTVAPPPTIAPPPTQTMTQTPTQTATAIPPSPSATITPTPTITVTIGSPTITAPTSTITPTATLTAIPLPTLTPLTVISTTVPVTTTIQEEATATAIIIEQPTIIVPTIEPTAELTGTEETVVRPTPLRNGNSTDIPSLVPDVGNLFDRRTLTNACLTGMAFTASIFLFVGVIYLLKSLIRLFQ